MNTRKAVYAASFDPITNGHINIIERMAPLYDELIVLVAVYPRKTYTFTSEERVDMVRATVAYLPNVIVEACVGRYVVRQAESVGAQVVIRGLRNFKDLESEQSLAEENRRICPHIETIWVPCVPDLMHVSSSMVKGHVGIDPGWEDQVVRSVPEAVVVKLKEKLILRKARKHWSTLMSAFGNPKEAETVLNDLLARYGEFHRVYHSLAHIVFMLDELELAGENDSAIALAIWFHDAVYDPRTEHNEEWSAKLARDRIREMGLSDSLGEQVSCLIMTTKHVTVPTDRAAQVLVDIDIAIFGKPEKEFNAYETGICKEYNHVLPSDFRTNRLKILQSFLNRSSIYLTESFRNRYEDAARENLERSIRQLRK